jgi:hypothetical protein
MEQTMPTVHMADEAAIREQAYYLWEQDGRPHGRDGEYWDRAVAVLTPKVKPTAKTAAAAKPKAAAKLVAKPKAETKPAPKLKAAASKSKAVPAKAEPAKKPKKK